MKTNTILHLLLLSILASGCVSQTVWRYQPEPRSSKSVAMPVNVVVPVFADKRPNSNNDFRPLSLIPIMPYGWQSFDLPEGARWEFNETLYLFWLGTYVMKHQSDVNKKTIQKWNPTTHLAQITAEEFAAANIFESVQFSRDEGNEDVVLQGVINSSNHYSMILSYGLSVFSPIIWCLGVPVTVDSNHIDITFRLIDRRNEKLLWSRRYYQKGSNISTMYYIQENVLFLELIKEVMLQAVADLRKDLTKNIKLDTGPWGDKN